MLKKSERPIVVIGAGIIGLTTAVTLLERIHDTGRDIPVHILADHLPNDPNDARYASTIAGAHHLSFADDDDTRQQGWDKRSMFTITGSELSSPSILAFEIMWNEWLHLGEASGLMAVTQTELFVGIKKHLRIYESHPGVCVDRRMTRSCS
jgi:D-amino-acid oxidase